VLLAYRPDIDAPVDKHRARKGATVTGSPAVLQPPGQPYPLATDTLREQTAPEAERDRRTLVGTCPDCGYPSLSSVLCAFCRPHLVR
jgi:hypothetical protein